MFWCCTTTDGVRTEAEAEAGEVIFRDGQVAASPPRLLGHLRDGQVTIAKETGLSEEEEEKLTEQPAMQEVGKLEAIDADEAKAADDDVEEEGPFGVTLEMTPGERLGALLDVLDMKTLRVVEVRREGRLRLYNARAQEHKRVLPGYYIVGVNGIDGGAAEMVEEMRRSKVWKLQVARSHEFTVALEKTGPLRVDLQFEQDSDCMVVRKIGDIGVLKEYNDSVHDAEHRVRPGDRILDVNDNAGPAKTLLETLRSSTDLSLKIARPLLKPVRL